MARTASRVVMLGTSFRTRGGVAAVLETYREAGLFERWPVDYVATHRDGTKVEKFLKAIDGVCVFLALLCRIPRAVLHVHCASRASFWRKSFFMAVALAARSPVILHLHGGGFATFYAEECGPVRRAIVRFFLDRAAVIVVVSDRWAAWMKRVSSNPRVVTIPNSVRLPAPAAAKREPALVVFAGRCSESKGIYDLLQAALALRREIPELRIECAGDGDLEEVERSIASLGLADRVRVHGWVGARRRDELLARAGIFVLPSHAEGLPMGVLEAMAAGCPVIASAVGGLPDLIEPGVNGLLIPAGDIRALAAALRRLIEDPAFARRLGSAARATIAARFTTERMLERLEQVYRSLGVTAEADSGADKLNRGQTPSQGGCALPRQTEKEPVPGFASRRFRESP
ncbi:MAG: glycosyltransferase family 4 protein [Usitatibacter sp.]